MNGSAPLIQAQEGELEYGSNICQLVLQHPIDNWRDIASLEQKCDLVAYRVRFMRRYELQLH